MTKPLNIQSLADFIESAGDFPLNIRIDNSVHWATNDENEIIYFKEKGIEDYLVLDLLKIKQYQAGDFIVNVNDDIVCDVETIILSSLNRISESEFMELYFEEM